MKGGSKIGCLRWSDEVRGSEKQRLKVVKWTGMASEASRGEVCLANALFAVDIVEVHGGQPGEVEPPWIGSSFNELSWQR